MPSVKASRPGPYRQLQGNSLRFGALIELVAPVWLQRSEIDRAQPDGPISNVLQEM